MNKSFYTISSWVFGERKDLWWILTVSCGLAEQIHVSRLCSPVWYNTVCPRVISDADGWASVLGNFRGEFSFFIGFTITYERKHRALCCSLGCNQPLRNLHGMCSLPTDKPLCPDGKVCGPAIST